MDEFEKGLFAEPYIHYASFNKGYNKAIDDFVKMAYEELLYSEHLTEVDIDYIAEQLKAGVAKAMAEQWGK